ncbi:MAG: hypothetical protein ACE5KU_02140 [Nitrososphaerales archaeon]
MRQPIIPALILQTFIITMIPATYADVSTTNPHIKTLEGWPADVELTCTPCHGDPPSTNPDTLSANCISKCHSTDASEIASSKHSGLKCIYCHAVLHIGDKDQESCNSECHNIKEYPHDHNGNDNFASIWMLDNPKTPDQKVGFREEFHSYTDLELVTELKIQKIEKGKIHIAYLDSQGSSAGSNATRYLTCLNCHFETEVPEEIGIPKTVTPGVIKMGVPRVEIEFRKHQIEARADEDFVAERGYPIYQLLPALIAIAAITIIGISLSRKGRAKG